ncbi:hypothetical protein EKK58_00160 [Candidatus Dependentiae bacterium]|nr:MAG: hypothetical protein EKK58_00160 [Candidatus Dependentiae bacterium]
MPIDAPDQTFDGLSDLRADELPPERDLESELFNKRSIRDLVTNMERELGLTPGKKGKKVKRHSRIIAPGRDEDAEVLNGILNDDSKYRILMWKDTWTVHGDYRIFLIYEEQLEDKKTK